LSDFDEMTIDELWTEMESSDGFHKGQVLFALFNRKYDANDFGLAHAYAIQASEVFKESGHSREYAIALVYSGNAKHAQDNYDDAIAYYDQAGEATIAHGDIEDLAILQGNKGNSLVSAQRYQEARDAYMSAEALFASQEVHIMAHTMGLDLGDIQMRFGEYETALATYTRTRGYVVGHDDLSKVATSEGRIADALCELDRTDEAVAHARECLNMAKTCPCPRCVPDAQLRLGKCLVKAKQLETGLEYIEKARVAFHEESKAGMQGQCLLAHAQAILETDPATARELLDQARSIFTGLDWTWPLDNVLVAMADIDVAEGNTEIAMATYSEVLKRAKELSRFGLGRKIESRIDSPVHEPAK
jgi:tetratricopeptide (TPR) repeat protein